MPQSLLTLPSAVVDVLSSEPGVVSAYLFGSTVEGRMHAESDVDLGVLLDRDVYADPARRFDARLRLAGRLSSALGRPADVVVLNDAPPQLARRILGGVRVVLTRPEVDHAFRRTTLSRAADLEPFLRRTRRVKLAALGR